MLLFLVLLPINNKESSINHTYFLKLRMDYILHSILFLPWMLLKPKNAIISKTNVWLSVGLVFAAFSEGIQYFVPYRAFNLNDLIANCIGIVIGIFLLYPPLNKQLA